MRLVCNNEGLQIAARRHAAHVLLEARMDCHTAFGRAADHTHPRGLRSVRSGARGHGFICAACRTTPTIEIGMNERFIFNIDFYRPFGT